MDVDRPAWGSTLVKNHDENKTYILVKLSESFSNAIQEYSERHHIAPNTNDANYSNTYSTSNNHANNNQSVNRAPTIKFYGTRGAIRFPSGKSYDFSLEQYDKSVECIKQTKNRWESVGEMAFCLHVKGKDDVYQRTRTKMEAAEQEKRKYCTKLLGSPENNTSSKQKTNITNSSTITPSTITSNTTNNTLTTNDHIKAGGSTNNNVINFVDISDVKQLKRCKSDLDKDCKGYQNPRGYLQKIEERCTESRETLKQNVDSSPEWEPVKEPKNSSSKKHIIKSNNINSSLSPLPSPLPPPQTQIAPPQSQLRLQPQPPSKLTAATKTTTNKNSNSNTTKTKPIALIASNDHIKAGSSTNDNNVNSVDLSKYPDITDVKQLKRYKADFDKDFKEYQNLYGYLQRIEERFSELRRLLKQSVEGSPEWESAKEQIFSEYEMLKGDIDFHRARSKYKQLHKKLAHIKSKIFQFKRQG